MRVKGANMAKYITPVHHRDSQGDGYLESILTIKHQSRVRWRWLIKETEPGTGGFDFIN
jgi:hypothetical protein